MKTKHLALLLPLVISLDAQAVPRCYEMSPSLEGLGDAYFQSGPEGLSRTAKKTLRKTLRAVKGNWKGQTIYLSCKQDNNRNQEVFNEGTVTAVLSSTRADGLVIESIVDYHTGSKNNLLNYYSRPAEELVSVTDEDGETVIIEKFRVDDGKTNPLIEAVYKLRRKGNQLTIEIYTFINGYLNAAQIYAMSEAND